VFRRTRQSWSYESYGPDDEIELISLSIRVSVASQLEKLHTILAEVIAADLSRVGEARTVFEETQQRGLTVNMLINNVGFGTYGAFETLDTEREQQEILLNVATPVDLIHHFVPLMVARRQGVIINIAHCCISTNALHGSVWRDQGICAVIQ